jgi:2-aminoethylphosphonate dioxygenase
MIDRNPGVEDCARLERDGYLVVRDFFDQDGVAQLMKWTVELERAPEVSRRHWVYREESITAPVRRVIQRIENFCPYHTGFDDLIRRGSLARWSSALLHGDLRARYFADKHASFPPDVDRDREKTYVFRV